MTDTPQIKLYTVEEFWEFTTGRDEDKLYELVKGEIREVAGSGGKNTVLGGRMVYFLNNWVIPRKLGHVTGADGSYILHKNVPDTVRIPDAGFISRERLPKLPTKFIPIPPDLAVEVVSPGDDADELREKITEYLEYGTRLIWVIYPKTRLVDVYRQNHQGAIPKSINDVLDGEDVLPGFTLAVKDIFENVD
jgi:Uma2 family endonuclease